MGKWQWWLRRGGESSFARRPQPGRRTNTEMLMIKYHNAEHAAAGTRNEVAAKALAAHAGWNVERPACFPPAIRARALYAPVPDALIVPLVDYTDRGVALGAYGLEVGRCDVVVLAVGASSNGAPSLYASVALWARPAPQWHLEMRAWCSRSGELWLASEPHVAIAEQVAIRLGGDRLRTGDLPWLGEVDRKAGLARADNLLLGGAR
jgi:hypothetical protein